MGGPFEGPLIGDHFSELVTGDFFVHKLAGQRLSMEVQFLTHVHTTGLGLVSSRTGSIESLQQT